MLIRLISFLCLIFLSCNDHSYKGVNLSRFVGSPIKKFIDQPQFKSFTEYNWNHEHPALLYGITFEYADKTSVQINIDKFEHMKKFDTTLSWKLEDVLKEKFSEIIIYKSSPDNDVSILKTSK